MKATQVDVVERTAQLLTGFNLSTAAPELGPRQENAGHRDALRLVLEVLEMEAERASNARSRACGVPRRSHPAKASRRWMRAARCPRR